MRQEPVGDDLLPMPLNAVVQRSGQTQAALFWRPQYVQHNAILWHIPFLFWIMEIARPRQYVEIGVGDGVAYMAACQSLHRLQVDAECHAVGVWEDKAAPGQLASRNADLYSYFSRILTDGIEHGHRHFAAGSVDVMLIDLKLITADGKPAAAVVETLRDQWLPKLSEQGILLMHGTRAGAGTEENAAGFVEELCAQVPAIRLSGGDGITALLYGADRVERLAGIAALPADHHIRRALVEMFDRLGAASYYEMSGRSSEERADSGDRHLQALQKEYDDLAARLEESLARYEGRHRQVATLQAKSFDLEIAKHSQSAEIERLSGLLEATRDEQDKLAKQRKAEGAMLLQLQGTHHGVQTELAKLKAAAEHQLKEAESLRQSLGKLRQERDALVDLQNLNEANQADWEQERKSLRVERDELATLFKAEEAEHRQLQGAHQSAQAEAASFKTAAEHRQKEVEGLQQELNRLREERDALTSLRHMNATNQAKSEQALKDLRDATEADRAEWEQERNGLRAQCEELAALKLVLAEHERKNTHLSHSLNKAQQDARQSAEQWTAERDAHVQAGEDHKVALASAMQQASMTQDALQKALDEAVEARDAMANLLEEEFALHLQGTKVLAEALERNENAAQALSAELRQAQIDKADAAAQHESEVSRYHQAHATIQSVLDRTVEERDALAASARTEFRLHLQGAKLLTEALEQNESVIKALTLELNHVQALLVMAQGKEQALATQHEAELSQRDQANADLEQANANLQTANADLETAVADARRARDMIRLSSQEELARHIHVAEDLTKSLAQNDSVTQALAAELHHVQDELSAARKNEAALMEINFQNRQTSPLQRFTAWAGSAARSDKP